MSNTSSTKSATVTRTSTPGNGKAPAKDAPAVAATLPAPADAPKPKDGRGRKSLNTMTPEQLEAWKATHPSFAALISYAGGKPNLEESVKLFSTAFAAYTKVRPTAESNTAARKPIENFDAATVAKIATVATDFFNKKAKAPDGGGAKQVALEPFVTVIFTALGLDPFESDEKRKSIVRALTGQLGYERVKVKDEKSGEWTPATGKHSALYRP